MGKMKSKGYFFCEIRWWLGWRDSIQREIRQGRKVSTLVMGSIGQQDGPINQTGIKVQHGGQVLLGYSSYTFHIGQGIGKIFDQVIDAVFAL